ncbi:MAG: phosphate signaling complex protein PhoU [Clostridium sp.]|nr:phosphate signaling complex protein PhoU [Clostridium sp.]
MRANFDKELDVLNKELINMGSLVEEQIQGAVEALKKRDKVLAEQVIQRDDEVDRLERIIESNCLNLILRQQPVAGDLRLISAILKIITDLERIGDQAQDISRISLEFTDKEFIKELTHIPQMALATIEMVKNSIDAFVYQDLDLARQVIQFDDTVDGFFNIIKEELIHLIREDVNNGEQAIRFLMIAKYFEPIGDHAENIAEWVLFSMIGEHTT